MAVETRLYNAGDRIATITSSTVQIKYVTGATPVLKYNGSPVDRIESDASSAHDDLEIEVIDGDDWGLRNAQVTTSAAVETQLDWVVDGTTLRLKVEYPNVNYSPATWLLSNEDGPPVTLKVVVKRV